MDLEIMGGIKAATHFHFDRNSDNEPLQGKDPLTNKWALPFCYLWTVQMDPWHLLRLAAYKDK